MLRGDVETRFTIVTITLESDGYPFLVLVSFKSHFDEKPSLSNLMNLIILVGYYYSVTAIKLNTLQNLQIGLLC